MQYLMTFMVCHLTCVNHCLLSSSYNIYQKFKSMHALLYISCSWKQTLTYTMGKLKVITTDILLERGTIIKEHIHWTTPYRFTNKSNNNEPWSTFRNAENFRWWSICSVPSNSSRLFLLVFIHIVMRQPIIVCLWGLNGETKISSFARYNICYWSYKGHK